MRRLSMTESIRLRLKMVGREIRVYKFPLEKFPRYTPS